MMKMRLLLVLAVAVFCSAEFQEDPEGYPPAVQYIIKNLKSIIEKSIEEEKSHGAEFVCHEIKDTDCCFNEHIVSLRKLGFEDMSYNEFLYYTCGTKLPTLADVLLPVSSPSPHECRATQFTPGFFDWDGNGEAHDFEIPDFYPSVCESVSGQEV